jgi:NhaP-type Na+/H+ or K+/H+ antiporter
MEHGLDAQALAIIAGCVVAWALISARAERINITAPMAFIAAGALLANGPLGVLDVDPASSTVRTLVEITLAVLLFADASRLNLRALRGDLALPGRLLGIGLPVTIGLGALVARLVYPGLDLWVAALIASAVAPTDAALGAQVVDDKRVPGRIRRALNVESGLNDGIATPLVSFFIAGAVAEVVSTDLTPLVALRELAVGALAGVAIGALGGGLLELARRRRWCSPAFVPIGLLALALLAYAGAIEASGNGFVAAFLGGMAFGTVTRQAEGRTVEFVAGTGELLSVLVWFVFGAVSVPVLQHASWRDVVYAVLSLTVIRGLAVAVALIGAGLDRPTIAFIGWFGPRGLASVVFALLAFDALAPTDAQATLAAITTTVVISVIAHGLSAGPLAARYGAYAQRRDRHLAVEQELGELPTRAFVRLNSTNVQAAAEPST